LTDRSALLAIGDHKLQVKGAKYQPIEETFTVRRGASSPRRIELKLREEFLPPPPDMTTRFGMSLTLIPAGALTIGSPPIETDRLSDETPHPVTIERPFYLGVHEVRVRDFSAFVKAADYQTDAERTRLGAWRLDSQTKKLVRDRRCTWRQPGWPQEDNFPV